MKQSFKMFSEAVRILRYSNVAAFLQAEREKNEAPERRIHVSIEKLSSLIFGASRWLSITSIGSPMPNLAQTCRVTHSPDSSRKASRIDFAGDCRTFFTMDLLNGSFPK